jgi:amino acid adenylation domain-containing protein
MERSLEMVVGMLGILKAGGAYVAMDGEYPWERLRYMEEDAQMAVVLVQEGKRKSLPGFRAPVISVDGEWEQIRQESEEEEEGSRVGGENLGYVMYTSGSTGEPKGVGVVHRGVVRLALGGGGYVKWEGGDVGLQLAPLVFDASTFEIWGSLLNGGRLEVYGRGLVELKEVGKTVVSRGVTVLWLTAGLFQQMVEEEGESLRGVREMLAGGDVLGVGGVKKALKQGCCVINGYGPTENTTFSSCQRLEGEGGEAKLSRGRVPIGKPIGNTQAYVLDGEMKAVGIGVEGELYLGGAGLARGYWRRAGLTAEKFVPNPYSRRGGERLYRSGDRVRWRESGELEFVGRVDQQVKIRGYRIELGEIEAVLEQHGGVKQAGVVVKREGVEKRLVGYVVMREAGQGKGKVEELRSYLRERLPEYMVPKGLVELEEMPLTVNGKLDRKALGQMEEREGEPEGSYIAPRNATEEILVALWEAVLKRQKIGIHDSFFTLGGDSLLGIKLCSDMQAALVTEKPLLSILFTNPTIAELAARLQANDSSDGAS